MRSYSGQGSDMSRNERESGSTGSANELNVVERGDGWFKVQNRQTGNICTIMDTFAEMFPMWVGRVLITAVTEEWALISAQAATGFASSIIMSPAEAGVEKTVPGSEAPDGRPGAIIQFYHTFGYALKAQMLTRIGQCVMTCPTTAAFNALTDRPAKLLRIGKSLSLFGDGFQQRGTVGDRKVWRIPRMDGEFIVEERFAVKRGVAGGMFLILAKDQPSGLAAAKASVEAIRKVDGVILPFPGGICASGSKVGSMKYKLPASTNHPFCPTLRDVVNDTQVPEGVRSVYELVFNGLNREAVQKAMAEGVRAATTVSGVVKITSANYGGKLGPYKAVLKEVLGL